MLQSCSVAVSNQITSDVSVYEETAQPLCVIYIMSLCMAPILNQRSADI